VNKYLFIVLRLDKVYYKLIISVSNSIIIIRVSLCNY